MNIINVAKKPTNRMAARNTGNIPSVLFGVTKKNKKIENPTYNNLSSLT